MNVNVDQCGIVLILRKLVEKGLITAKDAKSIAGAIATESGANIILSV